MSRPAIYTSFDWRTDVMCVEDKSREELMRAQLAQIDEGGGDVGQRTKKENKLHVMQKNVAFGSMFQRMISLSGWKTYLKCFAT